MNTGRVRKDLRSSVATVGRAQRCICCPVQQQTREITKIKSTQNETYAEAARRVKYVDDTRIHIGQEQTSHNDKSMKHLNLIKNDLNDNINMSKTDFVAFICAVVNGTGQVERRSDQIKIVVECANKFLNCIGISAEQVHKSLKKGEQKAV